MTDQVQTFGYPVSAVARDVARAGVGCAFATAVLAAGEPWGWAFALAALAAFAVYGARAVERGRRRFAVDGGGIAPAGGRAAALRWADLERLRLRYFSTRRDGSAGWFELRLAGAGRRLRIESSLEGFAEVVRVAAAAAAARGIVLDRATLANLQSFAGPIGAARAIR